MIEIACIILLGSVIIALLVERYFFMREMNEQLRHAMKAVMSRNINDYIAANAAEKIFKQPKAQESDEMLTTDLDDKDFDEMIRNQVS